MQTLWQDLRYGARMLVKKPGFTLVAVLTLSLGIGANTAVFILINALILRTLPVANPHELVVINSGGQGIIPFPMYRELRARQEVLTDTLAARNSTIPVRLTIQGEAGTVELDNVKASYVTASYWHVLGVQPVLGRAFTEEEDREPNSSEAVGSSVVLSYSFWERQFGRNPGVINRKVIVGRSPCLVIGVAPRGFFGERVGSEPDLWAPLISFSSREDIEERRGQFTAYMGRLKPGMTREKAQAAMTLLLRQLIWTENPNRAGGNQAYVQLDPGATGFSAGFPQTLRQAFTQPLWILMAITTLVLFVACANIANLLLARAVARRHEISVRMALGCSRSRLIRQLLTESLLLSGLGALAGLPVAWWGSSVLLRMVDTGRESLRIELGLDGRVLMFTAMIMIVTGIGFGLAPSWRASTDDLASAMKDQVRSTDGRVKQYFGRTLVITQVALSLLLLISAGLLIRSLHNLRQTDLGLRPENVLLFDLVHRPTSQDPAALARVAREVRQRVSLLPGVEQASVSWLMLFGGNDLRVGLNIHDYRAAPDEMVGARFNWVSPSYFETVGMSLVAGRGIEERDAENAPIVTVINEALARRYFPKGEALGRTMQVQSPFFGLLNGKPVEIVGIVRDAKYNALRDETMPMFYLSIQQVPSPLGALEVRTTQQLASLAGPVRNAVSEVTKDIMIYRMLRLTDQIDSTLASERLLTSLSTFFSVLALLLASIGLYGVLSYAVAQRTQEIGIRMALGARRRNVLWLVLRQSLAAVVIGIALGLSLALVCTRLLSTFLYGLSPTDPLAIALSLLPLILVALVACYLPARRATKVDPVIALRTE
jgi:predicted permease